MKIPTIDRLNLLHELWKLNLSDTAIEAVVKLLENTRIEQGHEKAELIAKEILSLIQTEISETELLEKLNQMK